MAAELPLSPAEADISKSKVLGDDDLLGEILLRVDSPTGLVRTAATCKRWLRRASDGTFLRLFRARHPPRLLGFFVSGHRVPHPVFVPTPTLETGADNKELAAAVRRASLGPQFKSDVLDCRNGRVLVGHFEDDAWRFAVLDPLRRPDGGATAVLPPATRLDCWPDCSQEVLLPDDDDDRDASCYCVDVDQFGRSATVQVSALLRCSGSWTVRSCARAKLATPPERVPMEMLLAGRKLYMVAEAGYLLGLDLAAARLFVLQFPDGVAFEYYGGLVLCRGSSAFYLLHVQGLQITVWFRRTDGAGEWVLTDTISVSDTCAAHLPDQGKEGLADGDVVSVVGVGDNAEFAFLELGRSHGVVIYMHLPSRRVEKVYQREPDNDQMIEVHPFVMLWPPNFPALDAYDQGAHQE